MLKHVKKNARFLAVLFSIFGVVILLYVFSLDNINNSLKLGDVYYFKLSNGEEIIQGDMEENNTNYTEVEKKVTKEVKTENINIYKSNKWRIKIPKLKVDAPISEGTSNDIIGRTVGHFEISSKWNGNVALAAHNRGYRCNFFQEIKKLQNGDEIIYCTEEGERTYEVVINEVIKETDWSYIEQTDDNRITLITCEENRSEYRRCIQGVEIK